MNEEMTFVTVCSECLQASCWQGIFMCDKARTAGTVQRPIAELRKLDLEHEDYYLKEVKNREGI